MDFTQVAYFNKTKLSAVLVVFIFLDLVTHVSNSVLESLLKSVQEDLYTLRNSIQTSFALKCPTSTKDNICKAYFSCTSVQNESQVKTCDLDLKQYSCFQCYSPSGLLVSDDIVVNPAYNSNQQTYITQERLSVIANIFSQSKALIKEIRSKRKGIVNWINFYTNSGDKLTYPGLFKCDDYLGGYTNSYASAVTPTKRVMLILDLSENLKEGDNSELMVATVKGLLDTLDYNDLVGLAYYDNTSSNIISAFIEASSANKETLLQSIKTWISEKVNINSLNTGKSPLKNKIVDEALVFKKSFQIASDQFVSRKGGSDYCSDSVVLVCSSTIQDSTTLYKPIKELINNKNTKFTFLSLGSKSNKNLLDVSCQTSGTFDVVSDSKSLTLSINRFVNYVSLSFYNPNLFWSEPVSTNNGILKGLETLIQLSLPVYEKSTYSQNEIPILLGVLSFDISFINLIQDYQDFNIPMSKIKEQSKKQCFMPKQFESSKECFVNDIRDPQYRCSSTKCNTNFQTSPFESSFSSHLKTCASNIFCNEPLAIFKASPSEKNCCGYDQCNVGIIIGVVVGLTIFIIALIVSGVFIHKIIQVRELDKQRHFAILNASSTNFIQQQKKNKELELQTTADENLNDRYESKLVYEDIGREDI